MLLILPLLVQPARAQSGDGGTENLIHEAGAGARAFGLGRAYVALANDPSGVFWNPAGLEFVPRFSLSAFHSPLVIEGANLDFVGMAYPSLNFGTIGLGITRVGVGDIIATDINDIPISSSADFDYTEIYISYAKKLPWNVTPGVTFKVQRQSFSENNIDGSAFGLDAGLLYHPAFGSSLLQDLSLGFHYQNLIKPQVKTGPTPEDVASRLTFGIMKGIPIGLTGKLNVLVDIAQWEYSGTSLHAGAEYLFREMGTLRVGLDGGAPTLGAGITYNFVDIDYSFSNLSEQSALPPGHRFSLTFNFGKTRREKIILAEEERQRLDRELVERTKEEDRLGRMSQSMSKGRAFLTENRYFDAYSEFQKVITDDPFNREAKTLLDSANYNIEAQFTRRQQEAIAAAVDKELAVETQKFIELHFESGKIFLEKKQYTDALQEFNLALDRRPDDEIIKEAIRTTQRRLDDDVRRLVSAARQEFSQGNFADALRLLSDALILSPEASGLKDEVNILANRIKIQQYVQRGLGLFDIGDYQGALDVFEEAQQLDPTNDAIRQYVERSRREMGGEGQTAELDPESERQRLIATDLFVKGRYQEAVEIWRNLEKKYPGNKKLQDAIKLAEDRIKRTRENQ